MLYRSTVRASRSSLVPTLLPDYYMLSTYLVST
jgi:hypothetical protein